jgi:Na+-driven multidrug efflux pump
VFQCLYQFLADTLRAVGNSRTPLFFLGSAMVMNILLDLLFIGGFGWAVPGAAWATTLSAAAAGVLCLAYCLWQYPMFRIPLKALARPDRRMAAQAARFGLPTGLQLAGGGLGGRAMQTVVNSVGSNAIAAYNAAYRIDNFLLLPCTVLGIAVATCTAQNLGAGLYKRVKTGLKAASWFSAAFSAVVSVLIFVFAAQLTRIFIRAEETDIVRMGVWGLRVLAPLFLLCNQLNLFISFFRGAGAVSMAFWISLAQIAVRILFAFSLAPFLGMDAVWFCMPVTWVACGAFSLWYYRGGRWRRKSLTAAEG